MLNGSETVLDIKRLIEKTQGCTKACDVLESSKSWVFLTPNHVFKLKKQVRDDLQDLGSLRARLDNCLMESDLNRRLAPDVYLGIVPVVKSSDGSLSINGKGEVIDWFVKMRRLPEDRMLDVILSTHRKDSIRLRDDIEMLSRKLVAFYQISPVSLLRADELVAIFHDQQRLNRVCLLDSMFAEHHVRFRPVFSALEAAIALHFKALETRVNAGWIRECHGDLRPEHICLTDPPIVFDCLEFNRNLRLVDPFSEVVFLGMEAEILGAPWIKPLLIERMAAGLSGRPDPGLLGIYEALHALLRTRLCLAHLLAPTPRTPEKWMPLAMRYFHVAERLLCDKD